MASLGIKLPITPDSGDGFTMIKGLKEMFKQNFKMLLLTSPGERIMDPDFGVGIKDYLFANYSENTTGLIKNKIMEQTNIYMPAISIADIQFSVPNSDGHTLGIRIFYKVPQLGYQDLVELTI